MSLANQNSSDEDKKNCKRIRIQKFLAERGFGSRRGIEKLLVNEQILLNGRRARVGDVVNVGDTISLFGKRIIKVILEPEKTRVVLLHKPEGVLSTTDENPKHRNVFSFLPKAHDFRWVSVGRLDLNTSGVMLFTNNGELAHRLMHPSYKIDREYSVRVYGRVDDKKLSRLREGGVVDGERLFLNDVVRGGGKGANNWFTCLVQSGKNREIRKIWESQNCKVSRLKRVRFANVLMPVDLRKGENIELGGALLMELCALVNL